MQLTALQRFISTTYVLSGFNKRFHSRINPSMLRILFLLSCFPWLKRYSIMHLLKSLGHLMSYTQIESNLNYLIQGGYVTVEKRPCRVKLYYLTSQGESFLVRLNKSAKEHQVKNLLDRAAKKMYRAEKRKLKRMAMKPG